MATTVVNLRDYRKDGRIELPEGVVRIDRATKYGNPFSHLARSRAEFHVDTVEEALEGYYSWAIAQLMQDKDFFEPLRGKALACWCHPGPCHGDIIVRLLDG